MDSLADTERYLCQRLGNAKMMVIPEKVELTSKEVRTRGENEGKEMKEGKKRGGGKKEGEGKRDGDGEGGRKGEVKEGIIRKDR